MRHTGFPKQPKGLRRVLFRLPTWLYRIRLGWLLGKRFVLIEHIGRRSGVRHRTVVEVVAVDQAGVVVASGFGPRSDWYQNLIAQPETTVRLANTPMNVCAHKLRADEGAQVMLDYARRHGMAARSLCRFMGFQVDGSDDDYRAVGRIVPFLRLRPI